MEFLAATVASPHMDCGSILINVETFARARVVSQCKTGLARPFPFLVVRARIVTSVNLDLRSIGNATVTHVDVKAHARLRVSQITIPPLPFLVHATVASVQLDFGSNFTNISDVKAFATRPRVIAFDFK